jgi:hypothetical protein
MIWTLGLSGGWNGEIDILPRLPFLYMPLHFMCNSTVSLYTLLLSLVTGSVDKECAHGHFVSRL